MGDPLALTLAADHRLCPSDGMDDQVWELELGTGDPPALSLYTSYGLRARSMRIFPRFTLNSTTLSTPRDFAVPVRLRKFYPNFLQLDFEPFSGIKVIVDLWIPDPQAAAGRLQLVNNTSTRMNFQCEVCSLLVPMSGEAMAPLTRQSTHILAGRSANLVPVVFLTGGCLPGPGPFPSLAILMKLGEGEGRTLTWSVAARTTLDESFELARHLVARSWEEEKARIELEDESSTFEIHTGNPEWDVAFALSQKTALSLVRHWKSHSPLPPFAKSRMPEDTFPVNSDDQLRPPTSTQVNALDAATLAGMLPGVPDLAARLVRFFLQSDQNEEVSKDRQNKAVENGNRLNPPFLSDLAWKVFQREQDLPFLQEVFPNLETRVEGWFSPQNDRDGDGFPEWAHPCLSALEDIPQFAEWYSNRSGTALEYLESPGLASLLCREMQALSQIAASLNLPDKSIAWAERIQLLQNSVEECWDGRTGCYRYRDRDSHQHQPGQLLAARSGPGILDIGKVFKHPVRLVARVALEGPIDRRLSIFLEGTLNNQPSTETLDAASFHSNNGLAVAATNGIFSSLCKVEAAGLRVGEQVSMRVMDVSINDASLCLPMLAGIPDPQRSGQIIKKILSLPGRYWGLYGIPLVPLIQVNNASAFVNKVSISLNSLLGEGLLRYGLREQAARLTERIMAAVIKNLKERHAFAQFYDPTTGIGLGEANQLDGLAPLSLFLETVGVKVLSTRRVILSGRNPYPWPVTVKYRGLTVLRQADQSRVCFPDGTTVTLEDPVELLVSNE
jgi:hypothetical protein